MSPEIIPSGPYCAQVSAAETADAENKYNKHHFVSMSYITVSDERNPQQISLNHLPIEFFSIIWSLSVILWYDKKDSASVKWQKRIR